MTGLAAPRSALGLAVTRERLLAAALLLVIAGVHFQQYVDFMSQVPTVGVLFLLNAAGAAGLALALLNPEPLVRGLAGVGGIGLALGSLVCLVIALSSSVFGYSEPSLRLPVVIAIVAEVLVLPLLGWLLRQELTAPAGASRTGR